MKNIVRQNKKIISIALVGLGVLVVAALIFAKVNRVTPLAWSDKMVNRSMFSDEAINGYDAVAYFTENKAVPGIESQVYKWKEAEWYFSSAENKALFISNPEKYLPQFGGYCSFAVSVGFTANTDPEVFEVIDDKLYLFADAGVKEDWLANQEESIQTSETNWK